MRGGRTRRIVVTNQTIRVTPLPRAPNVVLAAVDICTERSGGGDGGLLRLTSGINAKASLLGATAVIWLGA